MVPQRWFVCWRGEIYLLMLLLSLDLLAISIMCQFIGSSLVLLCITLPAVLMLSLVPLLGSMWNGCYSPLILPSALCGIVVPSGCDGCEGRISCWLLMRIWTSSGARCVALIWWTKWGLAHGGGMLQALFDPRLWYSVLKKFLHLYSHCEGSPLPSYSGNVILWVFSRRMGGGSPFRS